jgi:HTH-type transcriptional regulator/antitoxin HipB
MQITVTNTKQLGQLTKFVRKNQNLDQATAASLSGNGTTFTSEFENGKPTVEIGRVLNVLDALGIKMTLDIPIEFDGIPFKLMIHRLFNAVICVGSQIYNYTLWYLTHSVSVCCVSLIYSCSFKKLIYLVRHCFIK